MSTDYKNLEDYGLIGNLETCALIGADGSVDWLCMPYIDSPSLFAAILDKDTGGTFRIGPNTKYRSIQQYEGDTNILKTTFHSPLAVISLTDFMPVKGVEGTGRHKRLLRKLEWVEKGRSEIEVVFSPRFHYGVGVPNLRRVRNGIIAESGNQSVFLQSPIPLEIRNSMACGVLIARERETLWFVLDYYDNQPLGEGDCEAVLHRTRDYWSNWVHHCKRECVFAGSWHHLVVRSGLVLKLLTDPENGAIAASPTTSLPEQIGGLRNWDYRFAWFRDTAFTVQALYHLGHEKEAELFRKWVISAIHKEKDPSKLKILYPLHGNKEKMSERIMNNLSGYRNSSPVRTGNKASEQVQLDIFGEIINTIYETTFYGKDIDRQDWPALKDLIDFVCREWTRKDSGIWEMREERNYTHSKLMCWVAVNRGIKIAKLKRFEAPLDKWAGVERAIRKAILEKGFSRKLNSFVGDFESEYLDASSLKIPLVGFLPAQDSRVQGTLDAIMKDLMVKEGLVTRYKIKDGFAGKEGSFTLCTYWLINALALSGRLEEAEDLFIKALKYLSPLGLVSEEVELSTGRLIGNMPQAFSHLGIINSALAIGIAKGKKLKGQYPQKYARGKAK